MTKSKKDPFWCNTQERQWDDCSTCPHPCEVERKARKEDGKAMCIHVTKQLKQSQGYVSWQDYCLKHSAFVTDIKAWSDLTDLDCPCEEAQK